MAAMGPVEGLVVDIDGVLTVSWEPLPGAAEALARLRRSGLGLAFATNTTSVTRAEVADRLSDAGMEVAAAEIVTAPAATATYLRDRHPGARVLLVSEGDLTDDLAGIDLVAGPPVDVVVIGGAGPSFGYEALDTAFGQLSAGAPLVAMHRNLTWRTKAGLQLDSGGFVTALEEAAGVEATVIGKPSPSFFAAALDIVGVEADRAAMVGDDVRNDVLAAQAAGLEGILVRTGKYRPADLEDLPGEPDVVADSFADLPELLGR